MTPGTRVQTARGRTGTLAHAWTADHGTRMAFVRWDDTGTKTAIELASLQARTPGTPLLTPAVRAASTLRESFAPGDRVDVFYEGVGTVIEDLGWHGKADAGVRVLIDGEPVPVDAAHAQVIRIIVSPDPLTKLEA
jgi:hypothetical protein